MEDNCDEPIEINFEPCNVIFNCINSKPTNIANFLLLVWKSYIYACKCKKVKEWLILKIQKKNLSCNFTKLQRTLISRLRLGVLALEIELGM